ncbi:MAG: phage major capsid protein [Abitibacteriaceae bacterium]|nr:phage major capsid protein [Abditibacteriaceae bacterium]MBV9866485.1 phage major capsid protein [Abditibacteriaceae bacterium]
MISTTQRYDPTTQQLVNIATGVRSDPTVLTRISSVGPLHNAALAATLGSLPSTYRYLDPATGTEYLEYVAGQSAQQVANAQNALVARGAIFGRVYQLCRDATTTLDTVPYTRETAFTYDAAAVALGAAAPHAAFALVDDTAPVKRVAVDYPLPTPVPAGRRDYANAMLPWMVEYAVDSQIINGTGAGDNLLGLLHAAGLQAGGVFNQGADTLADPIPQAMLRAIKALENASGYAVTGMVMNPLDWANVLAERTGDGGASQGNYLLGSLQFEAPPVLWSRDVVVTPAIAAKTVLLGAFKSDATCHWKKRVTTSEAGAVITCDCELTLTIERGYAFAKVVLQ